MNRPSRKTCLHLEIRAIQRELADLVGERTMHIQGTSYLHGAQPINAPHRSYGSQPAPANSPSHGADELDISREADMVSRARELPDIRADKVARIKAQIASGTYETPEKLDMALSRLLDEIG